MMNFMKCFSRKLPNANMRTKLSTVAYYCSDNAQAQACINLAASHSISFSSVRLTGSLLMYQIAASPRFLIDLESKILSARHLLIVLDGEHPAQPGRADGREAASGSSPPWEPYNSVFAVFFTKGRFLGEEGQIYRRLCHGRWEYRLDNEREDDWTKRQW
jgi:hypothetical protein